jgi:hypothetical protein
MRWTVTSSMTNTVVTLAFALSPVSVAATLFECRSYAWLAIRSDSSLRVSLRNTMYERILVAHTGVWAGNLILAKLFVLHGESAK